jgi:5-methylcytosine-specific restriction endonuclease McrA
MTHRRWGDVEGDLNPSKSVYGKKAKKKKPKWQRDLLAGPCAYCGAPADTLDHKIPKSRGVKSSQASTFPLAVCRAALKVVERKADKRVIAGGHPLPEDWSPRGVSP